MLKTIDKKRTIEILEEIDDSLKGYKKKFPLYFLGGSALILRDLQEFSKDIDFITTNEWCIALNYITLKLKKKKT